MQAGHLHRLHAIFGLQYLVVAYAQRGLHQFTHLVLVLGDEYPFHGTFPLHAAKSGVGPGDRTRFQTGGRQ